MIETEKKKMELETFNPRPVREQNEGPQLYGTFISVLCVLGFIVALWGYMFLLFSSR
jgi:hypothetical protein